MHLTVEARPFTTVGYGSTRVPQCDARVTLWNDAGDSVILWQESSAAGFARYDYRNCLAEAQKYAAGVAKILGCDVR